MESLGGADITAYVPGLLVSRSHSPPPPTSVAFNLSRTIHTMEGSPVYSACVGLVFLSSENAFPAASSHASD